MKLVHEALGADVYPGPHAHLLKERDEALILARVIVGQHLADVPRVRQALAFRHAQEQACQPVAEIAADEQQVVVLELVEQLLGREVLALQRADVLQEILVGDHVGGRGGNAAEQVIHDGPLQAIALGWQVGDAIRRVRQHLRAGGPAEPLLVDGVFQQRIESGGDEQVEFRNRRQLAQRKRRFESGILEDAAQAHVCLFASAPRAQEPADDVVERVGLGQLRDVHVETLRQLPGKPVMEQAGSLVGLDQQQLGPDDGDDATLFDEADQVVPGVLIQ